MIESNQTWEIGDCVELMRELDTDSIDLGVTSPPYNFGGFNRVHVPSQYGGYQDNLTENEYKKWTKKYLGELYRIIKPTGSLYLNIKGKYANYNYNHPFWITEISDFKLLNIIIWNFPSGADINSIKWYPRHEYVFMFIKTHNYYFDKNYAKYGDVWQINHVMGTSKEKTSHPAQFPLQLVERIIKSSSKEGDIVLDPFLGSGTTLEACRRTNRNCIGFEIDPQWEYLYPNRCKAHTPLLQSYFRDEPDQKSQTPQ